MQSCTYVPSIINTKMELLTTSIWVDEKWAGFWMADLFKDQNPQTLNILDYDSEFSNQFWNITLHKKL